MKAETVKVRQFVERFMAKWVAEHYVVKGSHIVIQYLTTGDAQNMLESALKQWEREKQ